jgi:hypothetical protein
MASPVNLKLWQHQVNQFVYAQGSASATEKRLLRTLKNLLLGFAQNAWTCLYSCDSVTAGTAGDGVDRWLSDANMVWTSASAAHSWTVLKQAGLHSNFQICIDCKESGFSAAIEQGLTVVVSVSAGFTGGTTTARPTATDELVITNGSSTNSAGLWNGATASADFTAVVHTLQSTDGQCTRVGIAWNNLMSGYWMFDVPLAPVSTWTLPFIAMAKGNANEAPVYGQLNTDLVTTLPLWSRINGSNVQVVMTAEGSYHPGGADEDVLGNLLTSPNQFDQTWPLFPAGIACSQAPVRGRHGRVFDFWFVSKTNTTGNTYPEDDSRQWMVWGNTLQPWNGVIARLG